MKRIENKEARIRSSQIIRCGKSFYLPYQITRYWGANIQIQLLFNKINPIFNKIIVGGN
jgi:hypothetical protein